MPFATNDGVRIRYEVEGSGPPLLLHIGYFLGMEDWAVEGYVAALADRYRLVMLDPRGQGRSDAPHTPGAYTLDNRVRDVLAVLDAAGIEKTLFWGYSMGGNIGYALGASALDRLASLVIGGAQPFAGNPRTPEGNFWLDGLRGGIEGFLANWETVDPMFRPTGEQRARWLRNDAAALCVAELDWLTEPDLEIDAVSGIRVPTLIYAGTLDRPEPMEDAARLMPNASFVALAGLDHGAAFNHTNLVLPFVEAFLTEHATNTIPS